MCFAKINRWLFGQRFIEDINEWWSHQFESEAFEWLCALCCRPEKTMNFRRIMREYPARCCILHPESGGDWIFNIEYWISLNLNENRLVLGCIKRRFLHVQAHLKSSSSTQVFLHSRFLLRSRPSHRFLRKLVYFSNIPWISLILLVGRAYLMWLSDSGGLPSVAYIWWMRSAPS